MNEIANPRWNNLWKTAFQYIYKKYGEDELLKYWKYLSDSSYYHEIIEKIKSNSNKLNGIRNYFLKSIEDEGTEYCDKLEKNTYLIKIGECSAFKYFCNENSDKFDRYCDFCKFINSEISMKSDLKYKLIYCDYNGKCEHLFLQEEK